MMNLLSSPWIPAVILLLLACRARLLSESWLAPGPFALLTWSVYLVVPLVMAPEYDVPAIGVWIILLLVMCIAIGADLGAGRTVVSLPGKPRELTQLRKMLNLSLFLSFLGFAGALYWGGVALKDNGLDFSLAGFFSLGRILSVERYAGEPPPFLARALVIWVFPAALLGGMSFTAVHRRRDRLLCLLAMIPALLLSIIQATKANTVMAGILGLSGYLAMRALARRSHHALFKRKAVLMVAGTVVTGLAFFFVVEALRSHKRQDEEVKMDTDWDRAKSTALGYLAVFSHWTASREGPGTLPFELGTYTFGGVLEVAGVHPRQVGVYLESVSLQGDDSNIYTAFRGLIDDFSLPGAAIFCFAAGLLAGCAYRYSLHGHETWTFGLAGFYAFLLWSPLGSLFVYNGPILALLVGALTLKRVTKAARTRTAEVHLGDRHLGIA